MTKKHYQKVAEIIGKSVGQLQSSIDKLFLLTNLIDQFSELFSENNPRFKREVFKGAVWEVYCEVTNSL